ncbi:MAG: sulfatase-like hydrolase/transferase [Ignavibacteriales bacterium]|nr:sulfatase-like hydrolase/transferase [Ignavibacteriales bacterium]
MECHCLRPGLSGRLSRFTHLDSRLFPCASTNLTDLCVPCRTSLFTGFYPHQTQVQTNADINKPLAGKFKNMGVIFKDAGYDTGYIGKWHMAFPAKDLSSHGFEFMRSIKNNGADDGIPAGTEEFLKIKREKPFLLVTSFVNPHNICEWPRGEELPDGAVGSPPPVDECPPLIENHSQMKDEPGLLSVMKKSFQSNKLFPVGDFDEKKWREYRWVYYRLIEKVDALIGNVLQTLRSTGHYEDTVIVFTSDHGDMQGAHGWSQKTVFFEESTRVPLIISEPGNRIRTVNDKLVNTGVDILPTLCSIAGISLGQTYPGINVRDAKNTREYLVSENKMIQGEPVDGVKPEPEGRMVRSKRFKYCNFDIGERNEILIDLEKDPGEMTNLAGKQEYQAILKQHRRYLMEWCKSTNDPFQCRY